VASLNQPYYPKQRKTAMRILALVLLVASFAVTESFSQNLQKRLNKGVEAHKGYNLVICDSVLGNILQRQRDQLNQRQLGEALYYYNRNLLRLVVEESKGPQGYDNMLIHLKFYRVHNGFVELQRLDIDRWSEKAQPELMAMFQHLVNGVTECLDKYVDQQNRRDPQLRENILAYLNLAITILPESYVPHELKGQLHYIDEDLDLAAESFDVALKKYRIRRVLVLDNIRMANVYLLRSLMYLDQGNIDQAHKLVKEGYQRNEIEWKTFQFNKNKFEPKAIKEQEPIYLNNKYALGLLELELVVQVAPTADSTFILYKERESTYQNEFSYQFNYASVLEDVNPREAAVHYQKAIDIEPESFEANFALAQLYINLGFFYVDYAKQSEADGQQEQSDRGYQMMETGLPYLKRAHELNPKNLNALILLVDVCETLGLKKELKAYKSILDSIQKP